MSVPQQNAVMPIRPGAGHQPPALTLDNLDLISDFFCWDADGDEKFEESFCFLESPTPTPLYDAVNKKMSEVGIWLRGVLTQIRMEHKSETDFGLHYQDQFVFRVHREHTVLGVQLCIRRVKEECPRLVGDLRFANPYWGAMLNSDRLIDGGIVLFASKPGSGKSTTMGAMLRTRLETHSGFAKTLESPCELPLSRTWGSGICFQCEVDENLPLQEQYPKPFRAIALRGFPAIPGGGRTIIMLGEIRDKETAALVVQSAVGHLIMTSIHAENPETACSRLASMAGEILGHDVARDMLASSLRVVVSQKLMKNPSPKTNWDRRIIDGEILWSHSYNSPLASTIRKGDWARINNIVKEQRQKMEEGMRMSTPASDMIAKISNDITQG